MHDLKFGKLFPIPKSSVPRKEAYTSTACTKAANVYLENIRITTSMAMVPGYSFMNGENWGYAIIVAREELQIENPDHPEVQAKASKIWDKLDVEGFDQSSVRHFYESTVNAASMASLPGRILSHGALHGLLRAMIIQAWTAFEVLAETLHSSARVQNSSCFSTVAMSKKYQFRSLRTLFDAYKTLFDNDQLINAAVINSEVKALALVRHLLVHRNGEVDQQYLDQAAAHPVVTTPVTAVVGSTILLDGEAIRSLVDPVTCTAYKLLRSVDDWLIAHTP